METLLLILVTTIAFWIGWTVFLGKWFRNLSITKTVTAHIEARRIPEEAYYEMAGSEIERGTIRQGLWLKALSEEEGDDVRARARYIKLRVESMRAEAAAFIDAEAKGRRDMKTGHRPMHSADRAIVNCPKCRGKCGVVAARLLDVTCPHCGDNFRIQT